jgi:hypothetical protein
MNKIDKILKQYPYIGEDIQKAQKELNRYIGLQEDARDPLRAPACGEKVSTYSISDQTYNAVEKIIDRYQVEIDKYAAEINSLLDQKKWLDKAYSELTEDERRILYQYYDMGMSIRAMARKRKKDRTQMKNMIDFAVDRIRRIVS